MPITFGSNDSSIFAQRELSQSQAALSKAFERLSSGMRINKASDDAAALAIADGLRANSRVFAQGIRNVNDGISVLGITASSVQALTDIVIRIRELATQASSGSLSTKQRSALDAEAQQLSDEYTRVVKTTSFNGLNLFDGSVSTVSIQAGYGANGSIQSAVSGTMGDGTLRIAATFAVGAAGDSDLVLMDVNNDGFLDLIGGGASSTLVRLGNGDGTVSAGVSYSMNGTGGVLLTDLNNDGHADIVTSGAGRISTRLGRGDGSFGAMTSFVAAGAVNQAAAGDFNNDGKMDIAVGGSVLLGNGNGSLAAASAYSIYSISGPTVAADFNNDGNIDVAVGNVGGPEVAIALGQGNGTFAAAVSYTSTDTYVYGLRAGDLNGDGKIDLVSAGYDSSDGMMRVFIGQGNGTFAASVSYTTIADRYNNDVALADLNGDDFIDIVVAGRDNGIRAAAQIFIGNGNGTFRAQATRYDAAGIEVSALTAGDMNNDGAIDIALSGDAATAGQVYLSNTRNGESPLIPFSLTTMLDAKNAMTLLDQKLVQLAVQGGAIGAMQSRLESATRTLDSLTTNSTAAESRLRDADVAEEAAAVVRQRIVSDAAAAVLAQANQQPKVTLSLLG